MPLEVQQTPHTPKLCIARYLPEGENATAAVEFAEARDLIRSEIVTGEYPWFVLGCIHGNAKKDSPTAFVPSYATNRDNAGPAECSFLR